MTLGATIVASLVLLSPAAEAKTPKCFGKKATIVGTNADDNDLDLSDGSGSGHGAIFGTKKADVIVTKGGDDIVLAGGGNDLVCLGSGADFALGGNGKDRIGGAGGADILFGEGGNDKLEGGADDDSLNGGKGDDQMNGGKGDNTASFTDAEQGVVASLETGSATGEGVDTLVNFKSLSGSDFNDNLTGDSNVNFLFGNGGNDTLVGGPSSNANDQDNTDLITGGAGDDTVDGGDGFDMVVYQDLEANEDGSAPPGVTVNLGTGQATGLGTDTLTHLEAVWGSEFNDDITGDSGFNFLAPAGGDDQVAGGGGSDFAIYWFATGDVHADLSTGVATGEGTDALANDIEGLFGSIVGNDVLTGDNADNFLGGDNGNDVLNGGQGDDWLAGGAGDDTLHGDQGNYDLADFSSAVQGVNANLATGAATGEGSDTMTDVEALQGSAYNDILAGEAGANYLFGWMGNDDLNGATGNDEIDGGIGRLTGEADADVATGGGGNDICANAETLVECTAVQPNQITQHPLNQSAEAVASFRRNI